MVLVVLLVLLLVLLVLLVLVEGVVCRVHPRPSFPPFDSAGTAFLGTAGAFPLLLKNAPKNCLIWSARPRENSGHVDDHWAAVKRRTVGVNQTQVIHLKFGRPIWDEHACHVARVGCHVAWWSAF